MTNDGVSNGVSILTMKVIDVKVYENVTRDFFDNQIYSKDFPAIIRGDDFGNCLSQWTPEYLTEKLNDMTIKIHTSKEPILDFISKNFKYETTKFSDFIERCVNNSDEYLYLRSLGTDRRGKDISNLKTHFKSISDDISLPLFMPFSESIDDADNLFFSSVLRISSKDLVLWTHYDVMDNILLQVKGTKRVVLFSPDDIPYLYIDGDKSKVIDIDAEYDEIIEKFPNFLNATRYECILQKGDALFIPSLWFHNVKSIEFSISVNFFWKNKYILEQNFYDKNDTYGNRDLTPAINGFVNFNKAVKHIEKLPKKFAKFYLRIMTKTLNEKIQEL